MGFEELLGVNPWTALFTLANTVALVVVMKKFLFKPVLKMIEDRQKEIDDLYQDAGNARNQAQTMQTEYQQKLAEAQADGERIVREAVERGHNREEEIIRQASRDADAMMDKAASDIAMEKKKAINEAKDQISGIAMDIAGKVVGRQLNADDQTDLIDSFINGLGDQA